MPDSDARSETEVALSAAIRDHITATDSDGDTCVLVTRAVVVAEVLYSGEDGTYPVIRSIGDVPAWAAYGLLAGATEIVRSTLVGAFRPDDDPEED